MALYVRPDMWRSGVGSALMARGLDELRRDGWSSVSLWVLEGNERALKFYERIGFRLDGSITVHEPSGSREFRCA